jgi:hypothetical protein
MQVLEEFQKNFEAKDYNQALVVLLQNRDKFDPAVYEYNLGSVWARKEKFVESRVHFEKSIKLGLINKEVVSNLDMVKDQLGVGYLEEINTLEGKFINYTLGLDIYTPIILSSLILIMFLSLMGKSISIIKFSFSLAIAAIPLVIYFHIDNNYQLNIVREEAIVRQGPSKIFPETQILPAGMKFISKKNANSWYNVIAPRSHRGWIQNPEMETL